MHPEFLREPNVQHNRIHPAKLFELTKHSHFQRSLPTPKTRSVGPGPLIFRDLLSMLVSGQRAFVHPCFRSTTGC